MDLLLECATAYQKLLDTAYRIILGRKGKLTYSFLSKSRYFHLIERRFLPFSCFESLLDQNRLVFRYNMKLNQFSLIEADYLLSTPYNGNDIYIFLAEQDKTGRCFCRSFFPKEQKDYTQGQAVYTMLYKEKICLSTGEIQIQYDRLTPKNSLASNTKKAES